MTRKHTKGMTGGKPRKIELTTKDLKKEIQRLVREIVIKRDGTCILRGIRHCEDPVLQADHLVTRANSATYDDTRLIVCLCRSCHGGWKKWHKGQYDALVRTLLSPERVRLWDRSEQDSWRPAHHGASDWRMSIAALKQELATYDTQDSTPNRPTTRFSKCTAGVLST